MSGRLQPGHGTLAALETAVLARWAQHLRVPPNDLLLMASGTEAVRTAAHALLAPADVALLAQPIAPEWVNVVLSTGAAYIDVGRTFATLGPANACPGGWHRLAAERCAREHPGAVAILEQPAWTGADDGALAATLGVRAAIVDARRGGGCRGEPLPELRAALTIVALRDPDAASAQPVLCALVARSGEGRALRAAVGAAEVPLPALRHALAVLDGLGRDGGWEQALWQRTAARYAEWTRLLADRPGVLIFAPAGVEAAALCQAGDGVAVVEDLASVFPAALAWPVTPMHGLITTPLI